uniref:Lipocalin/cytosolic fatty-acid binding domain-containing protein n=1 Tax=Equus caballus TaxID=9796 RepID=A0A3Q2I7T1_HORSE
MYPGQSQPSSLKGTSKWCALQQGPSPNSKPGTQLKTRQWEISYIASSNREKINENGPFQEFVHSVDFDSVDINNKLIKLRLHTYVSSLSVTDAGKNEFQILHVSNNALIGSIVNVDKNGKVTQITTLLGNGKDIPQEDISKFKKVTGEKRFPEGNIVNILKIVLVTKHDHARTIQMIYI